MGYSIVVFEVSVAHDEIPGRDPFWAVQVCLWSRPQGQPASQADPASWNDSLMCSQEPGMAQVCETCYFEGQGTWQVAFEAEVQGPGPCVGSCRFAESPALRSELLVVFSLLREQGTKPLAAPRCWTLAPAGWPTWFWLKPARPPGGPYLGPSSFPAFGVGV